MNLQSLKNFKLSRQLFVEMSIFASILWLLTTISFFPSYQLAKVSKETIELSLNNKIKAGSLVSISNKPNFKTVFLNNKKMNLVNNSLIGVLDIYSPILSRIYSVTKVKSHKWTPIKHPELTYFNYNFSVEPFKQIKTTKLRIPSSVWKKVNDEHKEQKQKERALMKELLQQQQGKTNKACWKSPLKSKVVSKFGSPRTLPNGQTYFHTGVDLRAPVGVPIKATGPGKVAFADHMIVPGNLVVIDHGGGLYSRYMHLNKIKVEKGALIKTGDLVGEAGATGRVEGPHLHWEVIWKGSRGNPFGFLEAWGQICDQG